MLLIMPPQVTDAPASSHMAMWSESLETNSNLNEEYSQSDRNGEHFEALKLSGMKQSSLLGSSGPELEHIELSTKRHVNQPHLHRHTSLQTSMHQSHKGKNHRLREQLHEASDHSLKLFHFVLNFKSVTTSIESVTSISPLRRNNPAPEALACGAMAMVRY